VLPPAPPRTIGISEEKESLESLGLLPSATLVLVPVAAENVAEAYPDGGGVLSMVTGLGYGVVSGGFGLVSSGVGMVTGALGTIAGYGTSMLSSPAQEEVEPSPEQRRDGAAAAAQKRADETGKGNVRTLADEGKEDGNPKQEFYNGNTVSDLRSHWPSRRDYDADWMSD
jgi:hypothetical protein